MPAHCAPPRRTCSVWDAWDEDPRLSATAYPAARRNGASLAGNVPSPGERLGEADHATALLIDKKENP